MATSTAAQLNSGGFARRWRGAVEAPISVKLYWILRIGAAVEFIGHGSAGFSRTTAWYPYFALFGFSKEFAHDYLFFVTGTVDITAGILILLWPMRIVLLYMTVWGTFTAFLRPAAGQSWHEVWERGGNYGMPLALLLLVGLGGWSVRGWLTRIEPPRSLDLKLGNVLNWVMRISIALLLVGHGFFGVQVRKHEWYDYFGFFGLSAHTVDSAHLLTVVGVFEIVLGLAVLVVPWRGFFLFVLVYKTFTELLRPLVGQELFQFLERSGDYALPIALYFLTGWLQRRPADAPAATPATSTAEPAVGV